MIIILPIITQYQYASCGSGAGGTLSPAPKGSACNVYLMPPAGGERSQDRPGLLIPMAKQRRYQCLSWWRHPDRYWYYQTVPQCMHTGEDSYKESLPVCKGAHRASGGAMHGGRGSACSCMPWLAYMGEDGQRGGSGTKQQTSLAPAQLSKWALLFESGWLEAERSEKQDTAILARRQFRARCRGRGSSSSSSIRASRKSRRWGRQRGCVTRSWIVH